MYRMHLNNTMLQQQLSSMHQIRVRPFPEQGLFARKRNINETVMEQRAMRVLADPEYFKFTIVRHPWSRLVSGFVNKYLIGCRGDRACFKRHNVEGIDANLTIPLTLTELLLTLDHSAHDRMDLHFRPAVEVCDVEHVPYTFIGDLENAAHTHHILTMLKSPFPLPKSDNSSDLKKKKVKRVSTTVHCDRTTVDLAARLYAGDLAAFGYTMDAAYATCEKYGQAQPPM
jgi:hypothetical protein